MKLYIIINSDIWILGNGYSEFLENIGIKNALQLRDASSHLINRIKRKMGVWGTRIIQELKGIPCYSLETCSPPKNGITASRTFKNPIKKRSPFYTTDWNQTPEVF